MQTMTTTDRVRHGAGGGLYRILVTPAETGNTHFAFEAIEPPGGGPPLHIHTREDEFFLVLEGEITFYIDGRVIRAGAGQSAFVPKGAAHCFKNGSTSWRPHSACRSSGLPRFEFRHSLIDTAAGQAYECLSPRAAARAVEQRPCTCACCEGHDQS
jgi:mannose-6-phosphate isomerase-like protein (cupin superfamily)